MRPWGRVTAERRGKSSLRDHWHQSAGVRKRGHVKDELVGSEEGYLTYRKGS